MLDGSISLPEPERILLDIIISLVTGIIITGLLFSYSLSPLVNANIDMTYQEEDDRLKLQVYNTGNLAAEDLEVQVRNLDSTSSLPKSRPVLSLAAHDYKPVTFNVTGNTQNMTIYNQTLQEGNQSVVSNVCTVAENKSGRINISKDTRVYSRANGEVFSVSYTGPNLTYNGRTAFQYSFENETRTYTTPARYEIKVLKESTGIISSLFGEGNKILYINTILYPTDNKGSLEEVSEDSEEIFVTSGTPQKTQLTKATADIEKVIVTDGISRSEVEESPVGGRILFNSPNVNDSNDQGSSIDEFANDSNDQGSSIVEYGDDSDDDDGWETGNEDNDNDGDYPTHFIVEIDQDHCYAQGQRVGS